MLSRLLFVGFLTLSSSCLAGPIHDAARNGKSADISAALSAGADVNESDGIATPLYLAVAGNHIEAVKLLIDRGADVNLPAKWGPPAVIAASGCNAEILKSLLDAGANPDTVWKSVALLHRAAEKGALDCVKLLVERGADVNALTSARRPPIHLAIVEGHEDVAAYLRDHGAHAPPVPPISSKLKIGNIDHGHEIFVANCQKCHTAVKNVEKLTGGPNLWGVIGRAKAATSFEYSKTLRDLGGDWSYEDINAFISDPAVVIPGTDMWSPGLQDEATRIDIIAYLRTLSDHPEPLP